MFFFAEVHHQPGLVEVLLDPKSNVINWVILTAAILYGWAKIVPPMLEARSRQIRESLDSAASAREEARTFLSEQEQRIENAQKEADTIVEEAKVVAEQMKKEIETQTENEINSLHAKLESSLAAERQMVITEMRSAAAKAAIELSKSYLESNVSEADKKRLLTQFMQQVDTIGSSGPESYAPGADRVQTVR